MKNGRGFSLVELAIVVVVIALLLVTTFEGGEYFLLQNQIKSTNVKLNAIQKAMEIYVRRTGHLPCPSYLTENNGSEVVNCQTAANNSLKGFYKSGKFISGGVPYRDLNLSADMSYDSWGGKFTYKVYIPATENIRNIDRRNDQKYLTVYQDYNYVDHVITNGNLTIVLPSGSSVTNEDGSTIITTGDGGSDNAIAEAIYALISHGKDKIYAFDFNTNKQIGDLDNTNIPEYNNQPAKLSSVSYYVDNTISDDIVRYKTINQIIADADLSDLDCCITSDIINNLKELIGITDALSFGTDTFNDNCKYLEYNKEIQGTGGSNKYSLKCFSYGRLGILKISK